MRVLGRQTDQRDNLLHVRRISAVSVERQYPPHQVLSLEGAVGFTFPSH